MRRTALLLIAVLSTIPGAAQEQFFSESIEVRVINVDVVVTDKQGLPVTGLTRDDFEVFENGARRDISNFFEYRGTALTGGPDVKATLASPEGGAALPAAADLRSRKIIVFIDGSTLHPHRRNHVLKMMKDFLQKTVRPGDEVMIANWERRLDVALPFTSDVNAALHKIEDIANNTSTRGLSSAMARREMETAMRLTGGEGQTGGGRAGREGATQPQKPPIALPLSVAKLYAMRKQHEHYEQVESLRSVLTAVRGVEGRKALVFLTQGLTDTPGREAFDLLDAMKDRFEGGNSFNPEVEIRQYYDHTLVRDIATTANASGVTLYPIDASGLSSAFDDIGADRLSQQYNLTTRRLSTPDEQMVAMRGVAEATGGVALTTSNNFELGFARIASDLTSYYSLGYRAEGERKDTTRSIHVKLKKKGYQVRTRTAFVEKSLTSEMNDAVAANLFYPIRSNDLAITLDTSASTPVSDEKVSVPVTVKIPTANLTLVPDGETMRGRFSTFTTFVRNDGAVSQVVKQQHELKFPAATVARRKEITLKLDVTIEKAANGISIGVMDDISHATGFGFMKLFEDADAQTN